MVSAKRRKKIEDELEKLEKRRWSMVSAKRRKKIEDELEKLEIEQIGLLIVLCNVYICAKLQISGMSWQQCYQSHMLNCPYPSSEDTEKRLKLGEGHIEAGKLLELYQIWKTRECLNLVAGLLKLRPISLMQLLLGFLILGLLFYQYISNK